MSPEGNFTVFCVESYKAYKGMTGKQVVSLFEKYDVFDYIHEFYNILHTAGYQYINRNIDEYLINRDAFRQI